MSFPFKFGDIVIMNRIPNKKFKVIYVKMNPQSYGDYSYDLQNIYTGETSRGISHRALSLDSQINNNNDIPMEIEEVIPSPINQVPRQINHEFLEENNFTDFFVWASHGSQIGNEYVYPMTCPKNTTTINFFIDPDIVLYFKPEDAPMYKEIFKDINLIISKYRPISISKCSNKYGPNTTLLPAMVFHTSVQNDHSIIIDTIGLYHFKKRDGKFILERRVLDNNSMKQVMPDFNITYSKIWSYLNKYIQDNIPNSICGLGLWCCRSPHYAYQYTGSNIPGRKMVEYPKTHRFNEWNRNEPIYGFLLPEQSLPPEKQAVLKNPNLWSAFLGAKHQGCGINVLSVLSIIPENTGREMVACLPITGSTIFKLCDYIYDNIIKETRRNDISMAVGRFILNDLPKVFQSVFVDTNNPQLNNTIWYTPIKVYKEDYFNKNGTQVRSEIGHSMILSIRFSEYPGQNRFILTFIDPQQSNFLTPEYVLSNYNFFDMIFINKQYMNTNFLKDFGPVLNNNYSRDRPQDIYWGGENKEMTLEEFKQENSDILVNKELSQKEIEDSEKKYDALFNFLDENSLTNSEKKGGLLRKKNKHKNHKKTNKYKKYKKTHKRHRKHTRRHRRKV
jgi:hypothetical protein